MRKIIWSLVLCLAILLLILPMTACAEEDYGVIVGGTRITSANCGDVFGDGTVSYRRYAAYGRLTLRNALITDAYSYAPGKAAAIYAVSGSFPLQVYATGNTTIDMSGRTDICCGIYTENTSLTIRSGSIKGSLTVNMPGGIGIRSGGDFRMDASGLTMDVNTAPGSGDSCGLWIDRDSDFALAWGTLRISGAQMPVSAGVPNEVSQYVYRAVDGAEQETDITAADLSSGTYDRVILQPIFPDYNLYQYMFGTDGFDTDGDGRLSEAECAAVEILDISNEAGSATNRGITDLAGMRYLPKLRNLYCSRLSDLITELDVSHNPQLEVLYCDHNGLAALDLSNNRNLRELNCEYDKLTDLDLSRNGELTRLNCASDAAGNYNRITALDMSNCRKLTYLDCRNELLTSLDVSVLPELAYLNCDGCKLNGLDVSHNPELQELHAEQNKWAALDVSDCHEMTYLDCSRNGRLTGIDVSGNPLLEELNCGITSLNTLDVSGNPELQQLDVSNGTLTQLNISGNKKLEELRCNGNQLTDLDVSRNTALERLYCHENRLEELDVSKCPALTTLHCYSNKLTSLNISNNVALNDLRCYDNKLAQLDISATAIAAADDLTGYSAFVGDQKNGSVITVYTSADRVDNFSTYIETASVSKHNNKVLIRSRAILLGDIDGDGDRTNTDLTELLRYVAQIDTAINTSRADVNRDGVVDAKDVTALARQLLS